LIIVFIIMPSFVANYDVDFDIADSKAAPYTAVHWGFSGTITLTSPSFFSSAFTSPTSLALQPVMAIPSVITGCGEDLDRH
jgi:hypothetical protein